MGVLESIIYLIKSLIKIILLPFKVMYMIFKTAFNVGFGVAGFFLVATILGWFAYFNPFEFHFKESIPKAKAIAGSIGGLLESSLNISEDGELDLDYYLDYDNDIAILDYETFKGMPTNISVGNFISRVGHTAKVSIDGVDNAVIHMDGRLYLIPAPSYLVDNTFNIDTYHMFGTVNYKEYVVLREKSKSASGG